MISFFKEVFLFMYEQMLAEYNRLQHQINSLQEQIAQLPEGKLICVHNNKYLKWFQSDGHTMQYIPKKEKRLIAELASKRYFSLLSEDLSQEKKAIDAYLKKHNKDIGKAQHLLIQKPEYREFIASCFTPVTQELATWSTTPYTKNNAYPEQLIHKTVSGNLVRSKSEAMIDMYLYTNKIPFRYECMLQLGSTSFFPDFTIRHPKTGDLFYWEHFGMVDNTLYCQNMTSKLQLYIAHGIIPSVQLITTYETKERPLSIELIKNIIEHYFL